MVAIATFATDLSIIIMRIWLIQTGEPLPIDGEAPRLLRTGIMAQQLAERGHDVTWWCSTFNHWTKSHRFPRHTTLELADRYRLILLHSPGYRRNVSLARIIDHRILARNLDEQMKEEPEPDLILSSLPTVEMSDVAARFAKRHGAAVIVDVRDLWPDAFLNFVPGGVRPLAKLVLAGMYREARRALRASDAIIGVSDSYLQWGLRYAGRSKRETDFVFPLSYERSAPSPEALKSAEARLTSVGVDPKRTIFWFIGTFGRTYDLSTVIRAARLLHDSGETRAQFVLSGEGASLRECREMAADVPNVVFTEWVNSTEIEWLMRVSSAGLAAYVDKAPQGLPNKLFEYLAAGLPILSSLGAEAENLLASNGCGFTYTPGDAEMLAALVNRLIGDPSLLDETSAAARRTFDEKYSAERVYQPFIEFVERLAAQRSDQLT